MSDITVHTHIRTYIVEMVVDVVNSLSLYLREAIDIFSSERCLLILVVVEESCDDPRTGIGGHAICNMMVYVMLGAPSLTDRDLEDADDEREEAVVGEAAAVVRGGVGASRALEEAVHLPLEERQGA